MEAEKPGKRVVWVGWAMALACVVGAAAANTAFLNWAVIQTIATGLPLGCEREPTVPLFNTWTLGWNVQFVERGFQNYWDAPIFHPEQATFAHSETQPVLMLLAPLVWMTGSFVVAYNAYFLGQLVAAGVFAGLWARAQRAGLLTASLIAVLGSQLPFLYWQAGVLQLLSVGSLWLAICLLYQVAERGNWVNSVGLGFAVALAYYQCHHYGYFLGLAFVVSGPVLLGRSLLVPKTYVFLVVAMLVTAVCVLPLATVQRQVSHEHKWQHQRPFELLEGLSAEPLDFSRAPYAPLWNQPAWQPADRLNIWSLGSGLVMTGLGGVGLVLGLAQRSRRRVTLFWIAFGLVGFVLAQGTRFSVWGWCPYSLLLDTLPGFSAIRSPFRFGILTQMAIVGLAVEALLGVQRTRGVGEPSGGGLLESGTGRAGRWCVVATFVVAAMGVLAVLESRPPNKPTFTVPDADGRGSWIGWLRHETPTDAVTAFLPFPEGGEPADYILTTQAMYHSLFFGRAMVNGYSGFFPEEYVQLRDELVGFPDADSLVALAAAGVQYCVVDTAVHSYESVQAAIKALPFVEGEPGGLDLLKRVHVDRESQRDVYELNRGAVVEWGAAMESSQTE